ncbi:MAG: molybdopterin-synthase adenylyltransferase MoeB [Pseudomonadota bacterium]
MILVILIGLVIWVGGGFLGAPRDVRGLLLGLLYVAVLGIQIGFPETHPLRLVTGGSAAFWLILGSFFAVFLGYRQVILALRRKASPLQMHPPETALRKLSETELNRYARHIVLREIGGAGQRALKDARVLVIGAGGLGSPAMQYLAGAGVGTIGVIDDDRVENANLQRQIIHNDAAIGMPKVFSAQHQLEAQNPFVQIKPYNRRLTADIAEDLIEEYDVVLDGSDNFDTRYLVNACCVSQRKPLVSGALSSWEGQLSVFDPARGAPCYACVFPKRPAAHLAPSCAEAGVLGPLPGVIGTMMAVETIKLITQAGVPAQGSLIIFDALNGETRKISITRRRDCPVCGGA